ncbi:hypothetical protein [Sinorhizobium meliloti]|uniref:hypothetical protein n=1 Tax=Rhizobium meliloti TaxID=382 RepID=UPI000FD9A783|nr:hypothetical protein [Sinorhizobium meliloti]RVE84739.1 hypothetical protein CN238_24275 [Sinorhizobium meliloti]RVH22399.1 hypothetical protein CN214_29740 [Sinorhizobium meliloti]
MENELTSNLFTLAERYGAARKLTESTVGKQCAADGRFFSRIREGKTFTAKKYDEVVAWFASNWPAGAEWPSAVTRPERELVQ